MSGYGFTASFYDAEDRVTGGNRTDSVLDQGLATSRPVGRLERYS